MIRIEEFVKRGMVDVVAEAREIETGPRDRNGEIGCTLEASLSSRAACSRFTQ